VQPQKEVPIDHLMAAASWPIALAAVMFSLCMIGQSVPHVLTVFSLADPSGTFGVVFNVLGPLANICVVFLFMATLRRPMGAGVPVAMRLCSVSNS
jgi:hypothetical protein